jgi:putative tricarboxylic transport membrane protein
MIENSDEKRKKVEKITGLGVSKAEINKIKKTLFVKAPLLGYVIGVIPGAGATIASLISYNEAKRSSKEKHTFGKGNIEGIAASEGANNAAVPGALAPLLSLGIPGSASAAILIGALTMQGLQPGPKLFADNPEIPYSLFAALLISVPIMLVLGLVGVRAWVNVTKIPKNILAVIVAGICTIGAYAYSNSMYSVWVMVMFGIFGYFIRKIKIPTTPIVLAMVLGFMMEVNFRRAMIVSGGEFSFIFSRPISLILIILSIITLIVPIIQNRKSKRDDENIKIGA